MFKFELDQLVYYLLENKVHSAAVLSRIIAENKRDEEPENFYQQFGESKVQYATCHGVIDADKAFGSKEELLKSL